MAIRSTTSSNQPPPPFYGQHTTGAHRNTHRASKPNSFLTSTREIGGPWTVSTHVVLGRRLSPELATGTGPNTQITDSVTQTIVALSLTPPGL